MSSILPKLVAGSTLKLFGTNLGGRSAGHFEWRCGIALQRAPDERLLDGHQDLAEVINQLQDQHATLNHSRKLLEDLLAEADQVRTRQRITKVDMRDGKPLVGLNIAR